MIGRFLIVETILNTINTLNDYDIGLSPLLKFTAYLLKWTTYKLSNSGLRLNFVVP